MLGTRRQTKTTVQRHSLLQRQANVYSNQSSWFAWGLSFLGAYKTRKRNMKQFITKHTENKLSLIPTTIPLPTVLYEKKIISDWLQNCFDHQKFVSCAQFSHHQCQPLDILQLIISFLWLGMRRGGTFEQFCFRLFCRMLWGIYTVITILVPCSRSENKF